MCGLFFFCCSCFFFISACTACTVVSALLLLLLRVLSVRRPLKKKANLCLLLTFQLFFAAYSVVCAAVLLHKGAICSNFNRKSTNLQKLLVRLLQVCAFSVDVAASSFFVLLFLFCVLLLSAAFCCFCGCFLGRRSLKNPPLPLLTFQNVKNIFTIDELSIARKINNQ